MLSVQFLLNPTTWKHSVKWLVITISDMFDIIT
jgi:hypothetical protein